MLTPIATLQHTVGTSVTLALCILTTAVCNLAYGQIDPRRGPAGCVPVSERQMERGCYVLVSEALGELPRTPLFWQIDSFPTKAAAGGCKRSTGNRHGGTRQNMAAEYCRGRLSADRRNACGGIRAVAHRCRHEICRCLYEGNHGPAADLACIIIRGPKCCIPSRARSAWNGTRKFAGRPGGPAVIVPAGVQHRLTITGTEERTSLVLILYDASQPFTIRTHAHTWTPKELCH